MQTPELLGLPDALVGVSEALNWDCMRGLLEEHLVLDGTVVEGQPLYLRYKGAHGALVGWRVTVSDGAVSHDTFVTARIAPRSRLVSEAERFSARHYRVYGQLKPYVLLAEAGLLLMAFPADRLLMPLRHVVRAGSFCRLLRERFPGCFPQGCRPSKRRSRLEIVRYKPERRAVLRWRLGLVGDAGGFIGADGNSTSERAVYVRVHADQGKSAARATLAQDAAAAAGLRCSRPIGLLSPSSVLEDELPGIPLDPGTDDAPTLLENVGSVIAGLHALSPPQDLAPIAQPIDTCDRVYRMSLDLGRFDQKAGQQVGELAERLAVAIPSPSAAVLLHGDFHSGQLLEEDGRIGLVDFDRAGRGPAAYDLAVFAAHLTLRSPERREQVMTSLLKGYATLRHPPPERELQWYEICATLGLALAPLQAVRNDWRSQTGLLIARATDVMEKLERGR